MLDSIIQFIYSLPGGVYAAFSVFFVIFSVILYVLFRIFITTAKRLSSITKTDLDDKIVDALEEPLRLALLCTSLYLSLNFVWGNFTVSYVHLFDIYLISLMISGTFLLDKLGTIFINWYSEKIAPRTKTSFDDEAIPIIKNVYKVLLYLCLLILVLGKLGVEVTPLVTSLGIAGLAVALALQDSLGNFFAGLNISLDKPLKPGDYVEIPSLSVKGTILDIGWRSTRIKTWDNNITVVPNMVLAKSVITNYHKPSEEYVLVYKIGVDYNSDVDHVIKVLKDVVNNLDSVDVNKSFTPIVRFDGFGDFTLNFKIILKLNSFSSRYAILSQLQRDIYYAFKKEKINIPFPTQTIYLEESKSEKKKTKKKKKR